MARNPLRPLRGGRIGASQRHTIDPDEPTHTHRVRSHIGSRAHGVGFTVGPSTHSNRRTHSRCGHITTLVSCRRYARHRLSLVGPGNVCSAGIPTVQYNVQCLHSARGVASIHGANVGASVVGHGHDVACRAPAGVHGPVCIWRFRGGGCFVGAFGVRNILQVCQHGIEARATRLCNGKLDELAGAHGQLKQQRGPRRGRRILRQRWLWVSG